MRLESLDRKFSILIREAAGWQCARCGKYFAEDSRDLLHCSHFFSRRHKATRFDPENCDALCFECHDRFGCHPMEYEQWKIERMGEEQFAALSERARGIAHLDPGLIRSQIRRAA
jgi:hypothetical protein